MVSAAHSPAALYTSSGDGLVRGWDLRTGAVVQEFRASCRGEALSVAAGPTLVVAGVADNLALWDARSGRQMAHWGDTHAQDVTSVQLHPVVPGALVSGSEDGLLAVFDLSTGLGEGVGVGVAVSRCPPRWRCVVHVGAGQQEYLAPCSMGNRYRHELAGNQSAGMPVPPAAARNPRCVFVGEPHA